MPRPLYTCIVTYTRELHNVFGASLEQIAHVDVADRGVLDRYVTDRSPMGFGYLRRLRRA